MRRSRFSSSLRVKWSNKATQPAASLSTEVNTLSIEDDTSTTAESTDLTSGRCGVAGTVSGNAARDK
jgi:hypothetical protein